MGHQMVCQIIPPMVHQTVHQMVHQMVHQTVHQMAHQTVHLMVHQMAHQTVHLILVRRGLPIMDASNIVPTSDPALINYIISRTYTAAECDPNMFAEQSSDFCRTIEGCLQ